MLNLHRSCFVFPIHFTLQMLNLAFWATLIVILGLLKLICPFTKLTNLLSRVAEQLAIYFGVVSVFLIETINRIKIDINISGALSTRNWYLMMVNHRSYLDVILMIAFAHKRVPSPKFFLKKELIWLPFVGFGAWALDMPFMQRYSRAYLDKYPEKRSKDIETTRAKCQMYVDRPTTIVNFVEGTRYTPEKHRDKQSPYTHLLRPKAAGVAFTLSAMGELFTNIIDVSVLYPHNVKHPMLDMLCGNMKRIVIEVNVLPVDDSLIGNYEGDEAFRLRFQSWLNTLWNNKDMRIKAFLAQD